MLFSIDRNLLDACVLSVLVKGKSYGYRLAQELKPVIEISDSTLYPVLKRLQKQGWVTSYNEEFDGRNRRYYEITSEGKKQHERHIHEWHEYKYVLDQFFTNNC